MSNTDPHYRHAVTSCTVFFFRHRHNIFEIPLFLVHGKKNGCVFFCAPATRAVVNALVYAYFPYAGGVLRIEHTVAAGGRPLSDRTDSAVGLGTGVAEDKAGDPGTSSAAHHTDAATAPWRIVANPCQQSGAERGGEGRRIDDRETKHGMVLYNVAAGTQLHVR